MKHLGLVLLAGTCLAGCAQNGTPPLFFVQTQTLGVTANAGTSSQGAELSVGYRDFDFAIVPVVATNQDGSVAEDGAGNVIPFTSFTSYASQCNSSQTGSTKADGVNGSSPGAIANSSGQQTPVSNSSFTSTSASGQTGSQSPNQMVSAQSRTVPAGSCSTPGLQDALSVLGQFEANANATPPGVSLGKFFATGQAAAKLADGFANAQTSATKNGSNSGSSSSSSNGATAAPSNSNPDSPTTDQSKKRHRHA